MIVVVILIIFHKQEEDKKLFEQVTINGSKCTPNNLYTNEGLTASYKDLDQIFENSDDIDTSSDETAVSMVPLIHRHIQRINY